MLWRRPLTLLLSDGGVLAVGERAGLARAQPGDVVLITTEVLTLGPEEGEQSTRDKQTEREEFSGLAST